MSAIVRSKGVMPSLQCERSAILLCGLGLALANALFAQGVTRQGDEFSMSGAIFGEQTYPDVIITSTGGYVVWQDNVIDGQGNGIAARRLDATGSPAFGTFRVNSVKTGHQDRPQIALLNNGGAGVVWQGGYPGWQSIYLKLIAPSGTFVNSNDLRLNTYTNGHQSVPVITSCTSGAVAVAWSSMHQDGHMQGIYARLVRSQNGQFITGPFKVNQFTQNNQRNPSIAGLSNGNFVVVWISEDQTPSGLFEMRTDVFGRIFTATGTAVGDEFRINDSTNFCATPVVSATPTGFTVAWAQRDTFRTNGWEVVARNLDKAGVASGDIFTINTTSYGDQFAPELSTLGSQQLVVWTSMGQDGSYEGVFGRLLAQGAPSGPEFRINSRTISKQRFPAVASERSGRFLVVWSSYLGGNSGFDIRAQRFTMGQPPLPAPEPPFVMALGSTQLGIAWPEVAGFAVQNYELYADGGATPLLLTTNRYLATGLAPGTSHSYALAFVLTDGKRSEKSLPTTGRTWGADENEDGLPDDWQLQHFGSKVALWPRANNDSDGDGASDGQELLAGTDPNDPNSVLRVRIVPSPQGRRLQWNTQSGAVYQVQSSTDFVGWQNLGTPRFAAGTIDSVLLSNSSGAAFYRVIRVQ
jgi:hypothetical protein